MHFYQLNILLCRYLCIEKGGETDLQPCFRLLSELLYNLTADVEKRQRSQPSRAYFTQNGSQISQLSQQLRLDINKEECRRYTAYVKVRWPALRCPCCLFVLSPCAHQALMLTFARPLFSLSYLFV